MFLNKANRLLSNESGSLYHHGRVIALVRLVQYKYELIYSSDPHDPARDFNLRFSKVKARIISDPQCGSSLTFGARTWR